MTTLAANSPRVYEGGRDVIEQSAIPVIASDIIYEGAAVGIVDASGHARPLSGGDRFGGFANKKADNSAGAAAAINVDVRTKGKIQLSVSGAVITDRGQPVYATDDDTFVFSPVSATFIGYVHRWVSSGVVVVSFDVDWVDPWAAYSVRETLTGTKTFDIEDTGKLFCVTEAADGDALTLPAIADALTGLTILAIGAFGTTALTISPNSSDGIAGPDMAITADKDLILTKATQRRGDFVELQHGDADGFFAAKLRGTWAKEA